MTDLSIEHQNEIIVNSLLSAAGYFTRGEKEKKEVKPPMNPLDCLKMVNAKINSEEKE